MEKTIKIILGIMFAIVFVGINSPDFVSAKTLQEKDTLMKVKYSQAKQQYINEVEFYKNARKQYQAAKIKFQKQRNSDNKDDLENKAKTFLEKAVNVIVKKLNSIKTWVTNNRAISENDKQEIIAELDEDILWFENRISKIQGASLLELKEEAKEIREYWKNNRVKVKRIIGIVQSSRINFVINKAETASDRISEKINELKDAGYNVTELEKLLADFNDKIALAKDKYDSAKAKFKEISSIADADKLFREGHQFIKDANNYIKDVHALLVEIVKEMKNTVNK